MAKSSSSVKEEGPVKAEDEIEVRVDEFALGIFQALGFIGRLPDDLVQVYNDFKRVKDKLSPGRLSSEGFATVMSIYKRK